MALGDLSIRVSADINKFTSSMDQAASVAKSRMAMSAAASEGLRASLMRTSLDLQNAALAMGSSMRAANDDIVASSKLSEQAIQRMTLAGDHADFKSMGEKIATAIGTGVVMGVSKADEAIEGFKEKSKAASIAVGVIVGAALAGTIAGAVYTAYKVISATAGSIKGMMTGDFYKSENIDSVIKTNDEIKDLQKNLQLSSIEAGALNDALKRLGVDPGDYKTVFQGVTNSIHSNGEELDRLGVKYKDANGKFLEQEQILQNAKKVLDTYRDGWDRAQAAAAIGMGTYEQITQAMKANADQTQVSAERLNQYGLGMSQYGQQMIDGYQKAMREFDNENRLFADGIKRVIADAVMPVYTDMANFFKESWPGVVQVFRVGVSSIVGIFYGLKDALYIASESIIASVSAVASVVLGLQGATNALEHGDFKGAGAAIAKGWDDAKARIKLAGDNIYTQVTENNKKIAFAVGADGRDATIAASKPTPTGTKSWIPLKPKQAAAAGMVDDPAKKAFEGYLKQQDDMIAAEKTLLGTREQFMQSYYQQEYLTATDFYGRKEALIKENLQNELDAYDREIKAAQDFRKTRDKEQDLVGVDNKIAEIERKKAAAIIEANKQIGLSQQELQGIYRKFHLDSQQRAHQNILDNAQAKFTIDMLGRNTLEVQKLTAARQIDAEVQERIYQLRKKDPNADNTKVVSDALAEAEKQKQTAMLMIQASWDKQTSGAFGASEALRKYTEEAHNMGSQVEGAVTNALRGLEDAFVQLSTTGKLSFKSLADSITADIARMGFKSMISDAMGWLKGGGMGDGIAKLFSGATGGASGATANSALASLGTTATTSTTALSTLTASITAQDTAMTTATASLSALATAADTAAAALASGSAGGGASGIGALAGAAGAGASSDVGWEAMLAGAFAGGGDPPVGQMSLVGEKGPELFVPKTAGTIIPNDAFKNIGSGKDAQPAAQYGNLIGHIEINVPPTTSRESASQVATRVGLEVRRALARNV